MKANEAPEKIQVHLIKDNYDDWSIRGYSFLEDKQIGMTEYIRTDAFIEKACKGIEHLLSGYIIRNFHFGDSYEMDTLIEDFKKYMERDDK